MELVQVQVQDETGSWRAVSATSNDPQIYSARMREAEQAHPNRRIRVVDENGRVLDMLLG